MAPPMPSDPEVVEFITRTLAFYPADAYCYSVEQNRAVYDQYCAAFRRDAQMGSNFELDGWICIERWWAA